MSWVAPDETPTWAHWQPATDEGLSVRAMLTSDGGVSERVDYDAYGLAEHHRGGDVDGDGDVGSADTGAITAVIGSGVGGRASGVDWRASGVDGRQ